MTLIEVLFYYRQLVREKGKQAAFNWLIETVDVHLTNDITDTVSETGEFIDAQGRRFEL